MDLSTGQPKFDFDGFDIKLISVSILLMTRPTESWSGFTRCVRKVTRPTDRWRNAASFVKWIIYFTSTGKVTSSLHHGIFYVDVLHLERWDRVGLIGLYGEEIEQTEWSIKTNTLSEPGVRCCLPWAAPVSLVSQAEGQTGAWRDQSLFRRRQQCKPLIKSTVHGVTPVKDLLKAWHCLINKSVGAAKLGHGRAQR